MKRVLLSMCAVFLAVTLLFPVKTTASPKISKKKITIIKGEKYSLKVNGTSKKIKWSSSAKKIVGVNKKGIIHAKQKGKAVVKAVVGTKTLKCKVTVEAPKLNHSSLTLKVKQSRVLKVSGTKQTVKWNSQNKDIATVNSEGVVIGKKAGITTITATVGDKKYNCKVTVVNPTKRDRIDKKIYENEYFSVEINYIQLHEVGFTVTNKTDVDFTLMVSDLVMDGVDYHSSDSCWEIYSGASGKMIFYSLKVTLEPYASVISGTFKFIDDGGIYGGVQKEIPFEEVSIK